METTATLTGPLPTRVEPHDDRELVARFKSGETDAFDEIVEAHQERIARLAFRLLGEPNDVDDVTQEIFLAVLRNLRRFRGKCKLSTWLTTIAVNKCRSHRRRQLRIQVLPWLANAAANSSDAGEPREAAESHARVRRTVERLPARYREPIVLRYFEEMSVPQISDVLQISTGAVEVRLSRARRRLKQMLTPWLGKERP